MPGSVAPSGAALVPVALVVLLVVVATWYDGAFHIEHWAPAAILTLVTLLAYVLAARAEIESRAVRAGLVMLWAFSAWTLLSMAWAQSSALAWEGANRTFLYAALVSLVLLAAPHARRLNVVGVLAVGGIAVLALVTLIRMRTNGPDLFLAGRLDSPVGYRNGTAVLFAFPVWPLLAVAAMRGRAPVLRASAFAVAVLCLGLSFSTQSRGVALGLGLGAVVALGLGPDRVRRAWFALLAVAAVAVVSSPLLEPYDAFTAGRGAADPTAIDHASTALISVTAVAFAVALAMALFDNGLRAPQLAPMRRAARVGLVIIALAGVAGGLAKIGDPIAYANKKVHEFKDLNPSGKLGSTRLGSVGGQRYDLWRVAMREWRDHPLQGVGEGNYEFAYYRQRATDRNLTEPHSLPLRLLAETGIVGFGLFFGFVAALGVAIVRGFRRADVATRHLVSAMAAAGVVVLGQSLIDWIWLLPGIMGLGLLALAVAASAASAVPGTVKRTGQGSDPVKSALRGLTPLLAAAGLVLACVSVALPYLADVHERRALGLAASNPQRALSEARSAASLDPASVTPLYIEAGALESLGHRDQARAELLTALRKEPDNFGTLGVLGDLEMRAGRPAVARQYYTRALALNPRDVGLQKLARGAS